MLATVGMTTEVILTGTVARALLGRQVGDTGDAPSPARRPPHRVAAAPQSATRRATNASVDGFQRDTSSHRRGVGKRGPKTGLTIGQNHPMPEAADASIEFAHELSHG